MSVFFTSDLHLGHKLAARKQGFSSVEERDEVILGPLLDLPKKSKLFILGDIAFSRRGFESLKTLKCVVDIVLGNHDKLNAKRYLEIANNLHGALSYKNFIVTHIPVREESVRPRFYANIHGHTHGLLDHPLYFSVSTELNGFQPVNFEFIKAQCGVT